MSAPAIAAGNKIAGVIGFFDDTDLLIEATKKVRDARYEHFDCYTPYPVHGLEAAQGLKRSPLPYVTFVAGLAGLTAGFLLQYWTSAVDWPIIVGGKPFNSWPAWVPIMFECTVLFAALSTVGAMFLLNGMPNVTRRIFDTSLTRDRFAIVIEAPSSAEDEDEDEQKQRTKRAYKPFSEAEAADFLRAAGAKDVRSVYSEGWF